MRLPPSLTWTHLFPAGVDWSFAGDAETPDWFREQLSARDASIAAPDEHSPRRRRVIVAYGRECDASLHATHDAFGIVGIDTPMPPADALASRGFAYVRRFAVLPDLRAARWFVPLDSPAVSAAAFSLYTPARSTAKLKVAAAKLAMRAKMPVWYRHTLWIAQRTPPPLELTMETLFPSCPVRLALSSGAPEPARNRKTSVAILGLNAGQILGFAKIAASELAKDLLAHEQAALHALSARREWATLAPRLLFAGPLDESMMTVQAPLSGVAAGTEFTPDHHAFLDRLRDRSNVRAAERSAMIRDLRGRILSLPVSLKPELQDALNDLAPLLAKLDVPTTVVHGDFAPWNLRRTRDGTLAAFDWEYAQLDGLPLIDETHFRLQVGFLLHHWSVARAAEELFRLASSAPAGLNPEAARALHRVYLLDSIVRLLGEGYDQSNDMVAWYFALLRGSAGRGVAGNRFTEVVAA